MRLTRLQKGERSDGYIRTTHVYGDVISRVEVGQSVVIVGSPITEGATGRMVSTSPIVKIEPIENGIVFETVSGSLYQLDNVEEPSDAN